MQAIGIFKLLIVLLAATPVTVTFPELGEVAYQQALKDAQTNWRMMCFAAHPDDEDGATLAYYRYHCGVETHAVIATRGEGGQNEIGPELYEDLAVIRTKEMQAAAKVEGAQLHFLDLPDFGFSKSIEETHEKWGEEECLRRVVYMIRKYRPHVIITHHGRMKDHGHHQAIGKAVIGAFDVAGDENVFPEMLKEEGLVPWQPLRLFIRDFDQGEKSIVTDISMRDDLRNKTYAEIAADALRLHKSQGMEMFIERLITGNPKTYYDLVKLKEHSGSLDTIDDEAPLFSGFPKFYTFQSRAYGHVSSLQPLHELLNFYREMPETKGKIKYEPEDYGYIKDGLLKVIENKIQLKTEISDSIIISGQKVYGIFELINPKNEIITTEYLDVVPQGDKAKVVYGRFPINTFLQMWDVEDNIKKSHFYLFPQDIVPNWPFGINYHFLDNNQNGTYQVMFSIMWDNFRRTEVMSADLPIFIAPSVFAKWQDFPYSQFTNINSNQVHVNIHLTNYFPGANKAKIIITQPESWGKKLERELSFAAEDEEQNLSLDLPIPENTPPGDYPISVFVEGMEKPEETLISMVEVQVPENKYVGVVQSYDDAFIKTLERLGVKHKTIEAADFNAATLDQFTTIIVDIRAYAKRPDLVANNAALLEYVKRGGTVLCMYQKTFDWPEQGYAPYPITLSTNRVTLEDAPMEVLAPEHPLFNTPNKIVAGDWDGWIQERGLYFPNSWDDAYTPLLKCEDPGEIFPPGSCLIAKYGEGTYLYTALGWYRQLREVHPGAVRVFANMLAL